MKLPFSPYCLAVLLVGPPAQNGVYLGARHGRIPIGSHFCHARVRESLIFATTVAANQQISFPRSDYDLHPIAKKSPFPPLGGSDTTSPRPSLLWAGRIPTNQVGGVTKVIGRKWVIANRRSGRPKRYFFFFFNLFRVILTIGS